MYSCKNWKRSTCIGLAALLVVLLLVGSAGISVMITRSDLLSSSYRHEAAYWKDLGEKIGLDNKASCLIA